MIASAAAAGAVGGRDPLGRAEPVPPVPGGGIERSHNVAALWAVVRVLHEQGRQPPRRGGDAGALSRGWLRLGVPRFSLSLLVGLDLALPVWGFALRAGGIIRWMPGSVAGAARFWGPCPRLACGARR
jgi:hypothetical protein